MITEKQARDYATAVSLTVGNTLRLSKTANELYELTPELAAIPLAKLYVCLVLMLWGLQEATEALIELNNLTNEMEIA